jgi:hypothetical protein
MIAKVRQEPLQVRGNHHAGSCAILVVASTGSVCLLAAGDEQIPPAAQRGTAPYTTPFIIKDVYTRHYKDSKQHREETKLIGSASLRYLLSLYD